jgi:membrane protein implicated in regulation of membrane protease activity
MTESTLWWVVTGVLIAGELVSGTFYLLMLALGTAAGAIAAHLGANATIQIVVTASVGGAGVVAWYLIKKNHRTEPLAQANPNVNMDVGEMVLVSQWNSDGTAPVHYRGAQWTVFHRPGVTPSSGAHRVAEVIGNRLLVDKA